MTKEFAVRSCVFSGGSRCDGVRGQSRSPFADAVLVFVRTKQRIYRIRF